MLGDEVFAVNDTPADRIAKFVMQGFTDNPECIALVMTQKVFDVFQKKGFGFFCGDNSGDIKKQSALCRILKSMVTAQGVLFGYAGNREWLAREARKQYILIRNV